MYSSSLLWPADLAAIAYLTRRNVIKKSENYGITPAYLSSKASDLLWFQAYPAVTRIQVGIGLGNPVAAIISLWRGKTDALG